MRSAADEAFVASPSLLLTFKPLFEVVASFRGVLNVSFASLEGGEGRAFFDLSVTGVNVEDGILTNGVPSARVIRRGSGQDCCGAAGLSSGRSFARCFGIYARGGRLSRDAIGVYRLLRL